MDEHFLKVMRDEVNAMVMDGSHFDLAKKRLVQKEGAYFDFYMKPGGDEHYRLISYLAEKLSPGEIAIDFGTWFGSSALALSVNPDIKIYSYDIMTFHEFEPGDLPNVEFRVYDVLSRMSLIHDNALKKLIPNTKLIILDVDPHDGEQEPKFFTLFEELGFKGIVLLDDIHLNPEMEKFWQEIKQPKYDITDIGHFSGTGLVVFS